MLALHGQRGTERDGKLKFISRTLFSVVVAVAQSPSESRIALPFLLGRLC